MYKSKDSLNKHVQLKHVSEIEYFTCDVCGKELASESSLKLHKSRVHLKDKPFECEICGMKFGYKSVMNNHINSIHKKKTKK